MLLKTLYSDCFFPLLLLNQGSLGLSNKRGVSLQLLDGSQTLLQADELKKRFDQEGKPSFIKG